MEVHDSARKHGIQDSDILHACEHCVAWIEVGDDPLRYLLAGPDRSGNMLELVVLRTSTLELVIHAMKLRPSTMAALFGGET